MKLRFGDTDLEASPRSLAIPHLLLSEHVIDQAHCGHLLLYSTAEAAVPFTLLNSSRTGCSSPASSHFIRLGISL